MTTAYDAWSVANTTSFTWSLPLPAGHGVDSLAVADCGSGLPVEGLLPAPGCYAWVERPFYELAQLDPDDLNITIAPTAATEAAAESGVPSVWEYEVTCRASRQCEFDVVITVGLCGDLAPESVSTFLPSISTMPRLKYDDNSGVYGVTLPPVRAGSKFAYPTPSGHATGSRVGRIVVGASVVVSGQILHTRMAVDGPVPHLNLPFVLAPQAQRRAYKLSRGWPLSPSPPLFP